MNGLIDVEFAAGSFDHGVFENDVLNTCFAHFDTECSHLVNGKTAVIEHNNGLSPCETIFDLRNVLLLHCKNRSICHGKFLLVTVSNKYPPCHRTGGQRIAEQSFQHCPDLMQNAKCISIKTESRCCNN